MLRYLKPDLRVHSVGEIPMELFARHGIRLVLLDLDDTLVSRYNYGVEEEARLWLEKVKKEYRVCLVSNNRNPARVARLADHLGIPFLARAGKPRKRSLVRAAAELGAAPDQVAMIGDQVFTDVLGGKRFGAMTVLVEPVGPQRGVWLRSMRVVEKATLKLAHLMKRKG